MLSITSTQGRKTKLSIESLQLVDQGIDPADTGGSEWAIQRNSTTVWVDDVFIESKLFDSWHNLS